METSNFHKCIPGWLQGITVWHIYIFSISNLHQYIHIFKDTEWCTFFLWHKEQTPPFWTQIGSLKTSSASTWQPPATSGPAGRCPVVTRRPVHRIRRASALLRRPGKLGATQNRKINMDLPKIMVSKRWLTLKYGLFLVRLLDFWGGKTCFIFGRELPCWNELSVFFLGSTCRLLGVGQAPHGVNTTF